MELRVPIRSVLARAETRRDVRLCGLASFAGTLLLALTACLDPLRPEDVEIAYISATIGSEAQAVDTIQVRGTTRVTARAFSRDGYDTGLSSFDYESSDTTIAVVDAFGSIRGVSPGEAEISVTAQGVRASVRVVVTPSTIAYTIPVGNDPGAIAFSSDFARAYTLIGGDSVVVVDALGFFRVSAVALGIPSHGLAAAGARLYVTHPFHDELSVIATGTNELAGRIAVGLGARGIVAHGTRAFVAVGSARHVIALENGVLGTAVPVDGEPRELAISAGGNRLFATVLGANGWHVAVIDPGLSQVVGSIPLSEEPAALAASPNGERLYVLFPGSNRVVAFVADAGAPGGYRTAGEISVGVNAGGIAVRPTGEPLVIVSGEPVTIFHGETLRLLDAVPLGGTGDVAVRPDGIFAFLAARGSSVLNVVRM